MPLCLCLRRQRDRCPGHSRRVQSQVIPEKGKRSHHKSGASRDCEHPEQAWLTQSAGLVDCGNPHQQGGHAEKLGVPKRKLDHRMNHLQAAGPRGSVLRPAAPRCICIPARARSRRCRFRQRGAAPDCAETSISRLVAPWMGQGPDRTRLLQTLRYPLRRWARRQMPANPAAMLVVADRQLPPK